MDLLPIEFCDYPILWPDWFIEEIRHRLNRRDLKGLVNIDQIAVSDEHPLVTLTGNAINSDQAVPGAGDLPVVSVTEDRTTDDPERMGLGRAADELINADWIASRRALPQPERSMEGLIGDAQLDALERLLALHPEGLRARVQQDYVRSAVTVALWCEGRKERTRLGMALESVIRSLKIPLSNRGVIDVRISTERGLINLDFGRTIRGQETRIEFTAWVRTYSVIGGAASTGPEDVAVSGEYAPYNLPDETSPIHSDEIGIEVAGP